MLAIRMDEDGYLYEHEDGRRELREILEDAITCSTHMSVAFYGCDIDGVYVFRVADILESGEEGMIADGYIAIPIGEYYSDPESYTYLGDEIAVARRNADGCFGEIAYADGEWERA